MDLAALICNLPSPVSIKENTANAIGLSVYPVPFSNELNIISNNTLTGKIQLIDISGRIVYENEIALKSGIESKQKLPVLAQGVYIMEIKSKDTVFRELILKD
jgi:hypothetical protein